MCYGNIYMFGKIKHEWSMIGTWKLNINPVKEQTNDQIMRHHISKKDCLGNVALGFKCDVWIVI